MIRNLTDKLFSLSPKIKRKIGKILFYLGGVQFFIVMGLAYFHTAGLRLNPNESFFGWPSWVSLALVCLSSVVIITVYVLGILLLISVQDK